MNKMQEYYGAFLNLKDRLCVVIGGGRIAQRKVEKLFGTGAQVQVISPRLTDSLQKWAEDRKIQWIQRSYQSGDILNANPWLVFAATNDKQVNRQVWAETERAGKLINVADDANLCSFTVPASIRRGALELAISTSGTSPQTAKRLRKVLESDIKEGTHRFQEEVRRFH